MKHGEIELWEDMEGLEHISGITIKTYFFSNSSPELFSFLQR